MYFSSDIILKVGPLSGVAQPWNALELERPDSLPLLGWTLVSSSTNRNVAYQGSFYGGLAMVYSRPLPWSSVAVASILLC